MVGGIRPHAQRGGATDIGIPPLPRSTRVFCVFIVPQAPEARWHWRACDDPPFRRMPPVCFSTFFKFGMERHQLPSPFVFRSDPTFFVISRLLGADPFAGASADADAFARQSWQLIITFQATFKPTLQPSCNFHSLSPPSSPALQPAPSRHFQSPSALNVVCSDLATRA